MTCFSRSRLGSRSACLLAILVLGIAAPITTRAAFSSYSFFYGTGSPIDMTGATSVAFSNQDDGNSSVFNIGFNFVFDGSTYSQFSINTNGWMRLGGSASTSTGQTNTLSGASTTIYPLITPYWDDLNLTTTTGGGVKYKLEGTAPNRILVVEWLAGSDVSTASPSTYNFQARLYEGTSRIEFWYGTMAHRSTFSGTASIGVGTATNNYVSWTPGNPPTVRVSTSANNSVNINSTPIASGTVYTIYNCVRNISLTGNLADGGNSTMADNSLLLTGKQVQRGSSGTFQPFSATQPLNGCQNRTVTYTISGTNASDYQISPSTMSVAPNSSETPTITFTPGAVGRRVATLSVNDNNGFIRSYTLEANGGSRIGFSGDLSQGGTAQMNDGDALLVGKRVDRHMVGTFQPFTVRNVNNNPAASPASIAVSIADTSGQYSLVGPTGAQLLAGESFTPQIRFEAKGVNVQPATLTVAYDGETRTFLLSATSVAPGGIFTVNSVRLGPGVGLYTNYFSCVGEAANTQPLVVTNVGIGDYTITGIDFYRTDTTYAQGRPGYPLVRDRFGNLIPQDDYFISAQPGIAPVSANPALQLPITIPEGESRTLYITYVGQEPGKRFARAYIRTNGENAADLDEGGEMVEGLLNFQLFGNAIGGRLAGDQAGRTLEAMTFRETRVGDSVDMTYRMVNTGDCDLRISMEKLVIGTGDVNDFRVLSAFGRTIVPDVPMTGQVILPPDSGSSLTVRFKPQRGGSRRATLWIQTNDSTMFVDGVAERGAYYIDLYGTGQAWLDYTDLTLRPAVIGSGVPSTGVVTIVNSSTTTVDIMSIGLTGGNATEFGENPGGGAWPTSVHTVPAGGKLLLGVQMLPVGAPGPRSTTLRLVTTTGQTINVRISGEAGTQTLSLSPGRLFVGASVVAGEEKRATVIITNTGTLPIRLNTPMITGAFAADYRTGFLPRLIIEPGAVEYLEVTYAPVNPNVTSTATLEISSDAGTRSVSLEGASVRARRVDPDPTVVLPGHGLTQPEIGLAMESTSGVRESATGVRFEGLRPNPARDAAELVYTLARATDVRLELYDATGQLVREFGAGVRSAGEHRQLVDLVGLGAGVYRCRLVAEGRELGVNLVVVK
jgi:hypothetical protein